MPATAVSALPHKLVQPQRDVNEPQALIEPKCGVALPKWTGPRFRNVRGADATRPSPKLDRNRAASLTTITPLWRVGDTIRLGRTTLRVVDVRQTNPDEPLLLVVEDTSR